MATTPATASAALPVALPPPGRGSAAWWVRSGCEASVAAGLCYVFDWVFHNPFCGLLFQCGCTWNCMPWSGKDCRGGWDDCNVHNVKKPWCPWCRAPQDNPRWAWLASDALTIVLMVVAFVAARFRVMDTLYSWRRGGDRNWPSAGWARMGGMRGKEHGSDEGREGGEEQERPQRPPQPQAQAQRQGAGAGAENDDGGDDDDDEEEPYRRTRQAGPNGPRDPLLQGNPGGLPPRLLRWCSGKRGGAAGAEEWRHGDRRGLAIAAAAAVGAFVAWGTLMGIAFWLATDYPYFLFFVK